MKRKTLKRICVMGLTACTLITSIPVQAENITTSHEEQIAVESESEEKIVEDDTTKENKTSQDKEESDSQEEKESVIEEESESTSETETKTDSSEQENETETITEEETEEATEETTEETTIEETTIEDETVPEVALLSELQEPERIVYYDFEDDNDNEIEGQAEKEFAYTLLDNAAIIKDQQKGNVLQLPGKGSLTLPETLFENLGQDGFTISMWVKTDASTGNYTKLFDASNSPLGKTNSGEGYAWANPDFALAAGGDVYDLTLYVGEADKKCQISSKLKYDEHLTRGSWQYMTVCITPEEYHVYFDGEEISYQDAQSGTKPIAEVLPELFDKDYMASLKYASIGKSYYTSDADFTGLVDDIAFYKGALSADEVKELYDSFPALEEQEATVTMQVNMDDKTGDVKHGATGFLYGIGEDNVPDVNLLTAIKPYMCEQKPAEGLQHPNGDILIMADTFLQAGGDSIQIACPDIYANWPYEFESFEEYVEKLKVIVQQVKDAGLSDSAVYVLYNEPEGNWFTDIWSGNMTKFNNAWKLAYDGVKEIDENARVAGPNFATYHGSQLEKYMQFCAENDCIPDQMTWHVLGNPQYKTFHDDVAEFREFEKKYWIEQGKTESEMEIVVNEYADFTQLGVPGQLARWIGLFEDEKATACLAYWHISNNLCDLAASNNEPNGAWWLYKWYAEMSGETLKIDTDGIAQTEFYGVASLDENKKAANVILGGTDETVKVELENLADSGVFSKKVKVKFESTNWTGINGAAESPNFMKEEVYEVNEEGNVEIFMKDLVAAAAYNLTITPVDDDAEVGVVTEGAWTQTYEGEEATLKGNAKKAGSNWYYACSGSGQAQGINSDSDKVCFAVDVPEEGYYRFDMVYGAATGNNTKDTDANNPKNAIQKLYLDDEKQGEMYLENTLTWYMSGMHTEYLYLSEGEHEITVTGSDSEGKASVDCMYLTFVGDEDALEVEQNEKVYEAELSDFNILGSQTSTNVKTKNSKEDYSGAGYVKGLDTSVTDGGGIRFTTFVQDNGIYDLQIRYASNDDASINFYVNNTNKTLDNLVKTVKIGATEDWKVTTVSVFLKKGINIIDLDATSAEVAIDTLTVKTKKEQNDTTVIEAEDCELVGEVEIASNDNASKGQYVKEILASEDADNALIMKYDAPVSGTYELVVYQSNQELFGSHAYNAQMVDRFITIEVNGKESQNAYFRNTYSNDSFRSQCVSVELTKGSNEIKFYNNNYRVHKNGINGVNECVNYTPNLDKFEITLFVENANADEDKKDDTEDKKDETTNTENTVVNTGDNSSDDDSNSHHSSHSNQSSNKTSNTTANTTVAETTQSENQTAITDETVALQDAIPEQAAAQTAVTGAAQTGSNNTNKNNSLAITDTNPNEQEQQVVEQDSAVQDTEEKVVDTNQDTMEDSKDVVQTSDGNEANNIIDTEKTTKQQNTSSLMLWILLIIVLLSACGGAVYFKMRNDKNKNI